MEKGFLSILFLVSLSGMLFLSSTLLLHSPSLTSMEERGLHQTRLEMENAVDEIIRNELVAGLVGQLPADQIKTNINTRILDFLLTYSSGHPQPISVIPTAAKLETVYYLSLLTNPAQNEPISLPVLNANSHVLLLPLNESARYGEYTYTGGMGGSTIVYARIQGYHSQTVFAMPAGMHICASTLDKIIPCGGHE